MDSTTLGRLLRTNEITKYQFGGVKAADEIWTIPRSEEQMFYILNNEPAYMRGGHWLAILIGSRTAEFFDSAGQPPEAYSTAFKDFLMTHSRRYKFNSKKIQHSNSDTCGLYCMIYIYLRIIGFEMNDIVMMFKLQLKDNDKLVEALSKILFNF